MSPYRAKHEAHHRTGCLLRILMTLAVVLLLAYPFLEPLRLEVESVTVTSPDFPTEIGQLRVVYLADIHEGAFYSESRVRDLVTRVNSMAPDVILLGGDYAEDSDAAIAFFETAPSFHARYLTAAVMGNNDRTLPEDNLYKLESAMYAAGVVPLVNSVERLKIGSSYIYIAGIDDVNNGHPDIAGVAAQVAKDDYVIFMSHSPAALTAASNAVDKNGVKNWIDLALCGHTHGGQVSLFGRPLFDFAQSSGRYVQGWYEMNRANVLVTNGIGTSKFPVRLGAVPQIHVVTLKYGK